MTKTISFGYALDRACLKVAMAVIEPLPRIGINNIVIYNTFDKGYNVVTFVDQLNKIINGPHGKINVMITLDSAPFDELTEAKINSLPSKYRGACKYINRFAPDITGRFITMVDDLIDLLFAHNLMPNISWQLWQEPNSLKYFHGSFEDFKYWTAIKKSLLMRTGRPICSFGATASLITDPGNSNEDTEGCILVGMAPGHDWVTGSREAMDKLFPLLMDLFSEGKTALQIINKQS